MNSCSQSVNVPRRTPPLDPNGVLQAAARLRKPRRARAIACERRSELAGGVSSQSRAAPYWYSYTPHFVNIHRNFSCLNWVLEQDSRVVLRRNALPMLSEVLKTNTHASGIGEQQGGADFSDAGCTERGSVRGIYRQSAILGLRIVSQPPDGPARKTERRALHAESVERIFLGSWKIKMEILVK